MSLSEKQQKFAEDLGHFLIWIWTEGYQVTLGEAFRPIELADLYSKQGRGIKDSKHCERLAIDLNLFIHGIYQTDTGAYTPLGEKWESMGHTWGGRFKRKDGNHFEY